MIDLGNELNGYGEDENHDVPTYNISKHNIGRLADLQKEGFNTVAPPTDRAYRAIQQFNDIVHRLITNAPSPDEIRAREKDE